MQHIIYKAPLYRNFDEKHRLHFAQRHATCLFNMHVYICVAHFGVINAMNAHQTMSYKQILAPSYLYNRNPYIWRRRSLC